MSLPQGHLDDRTWADLMEEMRALIPSLAPEWTDHNPSDPGITLLELFAWLTEMLIYRANRLPQEHVMTFLRLLNGPDWKPRLGLDEEVRTTVQDLRQRHRAVTAEDYEVLAREAAPDRIARTRCVPRRNLAAQTDAERSLPAPAWMSVIVVPGVPEGDLTSQPRVTDDLLAKVWDDLEPRRLLTVRLAVVGPSYAPVRPEVVLARRPDVPAQALQDRVLATLQRFLHPLWGGPDGEGWPFGRDVYISELYQVLEAVPGVDYVTDLTLSSDAAPVLWHDSGDPVGLALAAHQLPWPLIDPARIIVGSVFVPVRVTVHITLPAVEDVSNAGPMRRSVKTIVRQLFPRAPVGLEWQTDAPTIRASLASEGVEIAGDKDIEIDGPPERVFDQQGARCVRLAEHELADLAIEVEIR